MGIYLQIRVHDQCGLVKKPEETGVWELCERMSKGRYPGPGRGRAMEVVVANVRKKSLISCNDELPG